MGEERNEEYQRQFNMAEERLKRAMEEDKPFALGRDFMFALHKAGLLADWPWVTKVVIVAEPTHTVQMFVETIPSSKVLRVGLDASGIDVKILPKTPSSDALAP